MPGGSLEAIQWLEQNVMGFRDLTRADRTAINHFQLLWSLFEHRVLDTKANAGRIVLAMQRLGAKGRLDIERLAPTLAYFRNRYVHNGQFTHHFDGLELRRADKVDLVKAVLLGTTQDPAELAAGILIIVFRFRNNLHHGLKWAYGIRDQRKNFRQAGQVLMEIMDMWGNNEALPS